MLMVGLSAVRLHRSGRSASPIITLVREEALVSGRMSLVDRIVIRDRLRITLWFFFFLFLGNILMIFSPSQVPGDVVLDLSSMANQTVKLGDGLRQEYDTLAAMKAGKLRLSKPNKYWVEGSHKRYVPSVQDTVLGIVVDSKPDNFLVDIKGPSLAFLPVLAFEGGTRRNIPKFEIGTLLYLRVVKANSGMNPELSCTDASGKAAEFGPLKDGYMFESSTGLSRMLLSSPTCPVLEDLGKKLSFEIAVGLNGRVWVNASSPSTVILVSNAIINSEFLSGVQQRLLVEKLLQRIVQ